MRRILCLLLLCQCAASKKLDMARKNEETVRLWFEEGWNKGHNAELVERLALRAVAPRIAARGNRRSACSFQSYRPLCAGLFCRGATKPTTMRH